MKVETRSHRFVFLCFGLVTNVKGRPGNNDANYIREYDGMWQIRSMIYLRTNRIPHTDLHTRFTRHCTCLITNGTIIRTQYFLKSQFVLISSPITSHLSLFLSRTLLLYGNTILPHPSLSLHAKILGKHYVLNHPKIYCVPLPTSL